MQEWDEGEKARKAADDGWFMVKQRLGGMGWMGRVEAEVVVVLVWHMAGGIERGMGGGRGGLNSYRLPPCIILHLESKEEE